MFKTNKLTYTHKTVVNIYIVYKIDLRIFKRNSDLKLGNPLLGAVKLIDNADFDKNKYSGIGNRFVVNGTFS